MGPKTTHLRALLERVLPHLHESGDAHWRDWIQKDLTAIRAEDYSGIEHFLSAFGGMGSINDRPQDSASAILCEAFELATEIRREIQSQTESNGR